MTIPSYKVDAAIKVWQAARTSSNDRELFREMLEAAARATPPEEVVVTEEMIVAGFGPDGWAKDKGRDCDANKRRLADAYRAMHSARPKDVNPVRKISEMGCGPVDVLKNDFGDPA